MMPATIGVRRSIRVARLSLLSRRSSDSSSSRAFPPPPPSDAAYAPRSARAPLADVPLPKEAEHG